jgi:hypothetical protein
VRIAADRPPQWLRMGLLVFKMSVFLTACAPQGLNGTVAIPLLIVAAWDGVRDRGSLGVAISLLVLHVIVVVLAKWLGVLCN